MNLRHLTTSALALALSATPVLAQTAAAPVARTSAPISAENEMGGGSSLLYIIAAVAIGLGFYFLVIDDDDSDSP